MTARSIVCIAAAAVTLPAALPGARTFRNHPQTSTGNIRELENVIETAVLLAKGRFITPEDLPTHI